VEQEALDSPIAVDVVVESQLLALENIAFGENSHPHAFAHDPFGDIAIWVTRVIEESGLTAPFGCVDILPRTRFSST
jgi:hypothetical protein